MLVRYLLTPNPYKRLPNGVVYNILTEPINLLVSWVVTGVFYKKGDNAAVGSGIFLFVYLVNNGLIWFWGVFGYQLTAGIIMAIVYIIILGLLTFLVERYRRNHI